MRMRAVVRAGIARHRWPPKIPRSIVNDVLEKSLYKHLHCRCFGDDHNDVVCYSLVGVTGVSVVLLVAAVIVLCCVCWRKKRQRRAG